MSNQREPLLPTDAAISNNDRVKNFDALLRDINSLDDKKRQLWREIYENAIEDRSNAYMMYTQLVRIVDNKSTEHAVHGRSLASYLERMSKATDQLIKLTEMISKASGNGNDDNLSPEQIYSKIRSS